MKNFEVTIIVMEFHPIKRIWVKREYTGDFEAANREGAKDSALEWYSEELGESKDLIQIKKCTAIG